MACRGHALAATCLRHATRNKIPRYNIAFLCCRKTPVATTRFSRVTCIPSQPNIPRRSPAIRVCGIIYSLYRTISRAVEFFLSLPFFYLLSTQSFRVTGTSARGTEEWVGRRFGMRPGGAGGRKGLTSWPAWFPNRKRRSLSCFTSLCTASSGNRLLYTRAD